MKDLKDYNNMQYRFKIILSPELEKNIITFTNQNFTIELLLNVIRAIRCCKFMVYFLIPVELKSYFNIDGYRILLDEIYSSSSQSNVFFYDKRNDCKTQFLVNNINTDYKFSINVFLYLLKNADFPVFLDYRPLKIQKKKCTESKCSNLNCSIDIDYNNPSFNIKSIDEMINFIAKRNYEDSIFSIKTINKDTINDIMYLICRIHNIPETDYNKIKSIKYRNDFFYDIKNSNITDLKNILFSLFRGIVYPPAKGKQRKAYSLDKHKNTPFIVNEYKLYRIDVVPPKVSGIRGNSGRKRLLIGEKNGDIEILAYTDNHDFSKVLIKKRTV